MLDCGMTTDGSTSESGTGRRYSVGLCVADDASLSAPFDFVVDEFIIANIRRIREIKTKIISAMVRTDSADCWLRRH